MVNKLNDKTPITTSFSINEEAYYYYFHFLHKRMEVFWNKHHKNFPLTDDPILASHKFTNVYRVLDRVSQYLINSVIYTKGDFSQEDILFRILLFKIFNRIDTWQYLESNLGIITIENFDKEKVIRLLNSRIKTTPIFSAAYLMSSNHHLYNHYPTRHERWLNMIEKEFLNENLFTKIIHAKSMEDVYYLLKSRTFIGDFLAYQYTIDFNYSEVINFDENDFVKAGIGAIRGIKKCFNNLGEHSYEDAIKFTHTNFKFYLKKYGFDDALLIKGRIPTLIDLQNCFCETDKYLRVKMPKLNLGNTRIKQKYNPQKIKASIDYKFPNRWNVKF